MFWFYGELIFLCLICLTLLWSCSIIVPISIDVTDTQMKIIKFRKKLLKPANSMWSTRSLVKLHNNNIWCLLKKLKTERKWRHSEVEICFYPSLWNFVFQHFPKSQFDPSSVFDNRVLYCITKLFRPLWKCINLYLSLFYLFLLILAVATLLRDAIIYFPQVLGITRVVYMSIYLCSMQCKFDLPGWHHACILKFEWVSHLGLVFQRASLWNTSPKWLTLLNS